MANKYAHLSRQKVAKQELHKKIHRKGFVNCSKKRAFETSDKAIAFLDRKGYEGDQYKCPHCFMWHNTSGNK